MRKGWILALAIGVMPAGVGARSPALLDVPEYSGTWYVRSEARGSRVCEVRLEIRPVEISKTVISVQPADVHADRDCLQAVAPMKEDRRTSETNRWSTDSGGLGFMLDGRWFSFSREESFLLKLREGSAANHQVVMVRSGLQDDATVPRMIADLQIQDVRSADADRMAMESYVQQDRMERWTMAGISLVGVALLIWLAVRGRRL